MALKKTQRSLKTWTGQKWRTRSGKPSVQGKDATGEKISTSSKDKEYVKKEYDRLTRKKRADLKKGKQYSRAKKRGK